MKAENSPTDIKTLLYKVNRDVPLAKEIISSLKLLCMHACVCIRMHVHMAIYKTTSYYKLSFTVFSVIFKGFL